jgi:hypothetical protein
VLPAFKLVSDSGQRGATQTTDTQALPIRSRQGLGADTAIMSHTSDSDYLAPSPFPKLTKRCIASVLAELAQTRPDIGIVQRAIAAIRTWLRENVPGLSKLSMTDAEIIRSYIIPARDFVERSANGSLGGRIEPTFSRGAGLLAPNGKPSNLTPGQHAQVRTPEFKKWFGDWELKAQATVSRTADTFGTARTQAAEFVGKPLTNKSTKLVAVVSNTSLNKMLNEKAVGKSESPSLHSFAVANADQLFERAEVAWQKPDDKGDSNIKAIHRFFAPISVNGKMMLAKLTVKETADAATANRLYSVESVEFNEKSPAAQWVAASAAADGIDLTSTRSARDALSLAQRVQDFNPDAISKAVDENGEPMVMYTGTSSDKDFTKFKMPKNGTWFTKWPDSASDYAMDNDSRGLKYNPDTRRYDDVNSASRVMPVFLNIRNEHKLTWDEHQSVNVNNYKAAQSKLFDSLRPKGIDGIQWSPAEWVVIGSATQIKSAIGNNGDFDSTNPDIRFSRSIGDTLTSATNSARDVNLPAGYKVGDYHDKCWCATLASTGGASGKSAAGFAASAVKGSGE